MFRRHYIGVSAAILLSLSTSVLADSAFVVQGIQVQGLQRISQSTVMSLMPIHVGETYNAEEGDEIVSKLFQTGFFSNVQLMRNGNTLVVHVVERPTIDSITITGNKSIKAHQLKPVLKKLGVVIGNTFDPSELHAIVLGLQQQYALTGRSSATVTPRVTQLSRNRVAIHIAIVEGKASIVRSIQVDGNHAFSEHEVLSQFKLTTPGILTWFNHKDRYSHMRLDQDLQNLQNFYYNHGYLDFRVLSHSVKALPNGKGVSIRVHIYEGPVYHLSGYQLQDPQLPASLAPKIKEILASGLQKGMVFSRQDIIDLNQHVGNYLADRGYAFPVINPVPNINHKTRQVFLVYTIQSGHRVYVRKIHVVGNTRTSGIVVRTQLRQMEGAPYSLENVKESKRRIENLGYLNHVEVTTKPVPGTNNQVDLDYHVHEQNAGRASVQAGYSDVDGFLYGANVSEPNFMGSGKYVSVGFQRSAYTSSYSFAYNNPFYTTTGVSRGFSVYYNNTTPGNVNLESYTMDDYGATLTYGIPISEYDQVTLGGGFDHITIGNVSTTVSPSVSQFLTTNPSPYNQLKVVSGISHVTLDRAIFPTKGNEQDITGTLGVSAYHSSLGYYQLGYDGRVYYPVGLGFIVNPHMTLGYGNGYGNNSQLPFFDNYYAGGLQTLPGYTANTLGPKNPNDTTQALGGNVQVLGGLNFILPDFISHKVRTAVILDAGNIFQTDHVAGVSYENISISNLRATAGVMVSWWSPLGAPLDFSLAVPLNKKPGDQLSIIGFSFGAAI